MPPTLSEVKAYCQDRHREGHPAVNPEAFVDFYSSNGWKVGKNSMKDWKAAVRTWEQREKKPQRDPPREQPKKPYEISNRPRSADEWADLEKRLLTGGRA